MSRCSVNIDRGTGEFNTEYGSRMEAGLLVLVLLVFGVALFAWWLVMLIDALRTPSSTWQSADQSQLLYVLLMVFLGVIGTLVYVVVARPQFRNV